MEMLGQSYHAVVGCPFERLLFVSPVVSGVVALICFVGYLRWLCLFLRLSLVGPALLQLLLGAPLWSLLPRFFCCDCHSRRGFPQLVIATLIVASHSCVIAALAISFDICFSGCLPVAACSCFIAAYASFQCQHHALVPSPLLFVSPVVFGRDPLPLWEFMFVSPVVSGGLIFVWGVAPI
jgi:hypothetical protein